MSTISNGDTLSQDLAGARVAPLARTRPFYWSLRRELWEYRSVWVAPLVVSGVILFGDIVRLARLPQIAQHTQNLPRWKQYLEFTLPFAIATASILVTGLIVAVFYCLGALANERRDRSILFWKSLPVSDLTAVLAKACVPMFIIPLVATAVALMTQIIMFGAASVVLSVRGFGLEPVWTHWSILQAFLATLYTVFVGTLWYAPIYGWLLMVSTWAKRMTFLWAILTPIGISIVEKIALDTSYFGSFLHYRLHGFAELAFAKPPHDAESFHVVDLVALMTPARFFGSPGLWIGLLVAVAFLAASIWLRRDREPV